MSGYIRSGKNVAYIYLDTYVYRYLYLDALKSWVYRISISDMLVPCISICIYDTSA
jgi:hypothetical protein